MAAMESTTVATGTSRSGQHAGGLQPTSAQAPRTTEVLPEFCQLQNWLPLAPEIELCKGLPALWQLNSAHVISTPSPGWLHVPQLILCCHGITHDIHCSCCIVVQQMQPGLCQADHDACKASVARGIDA